MNDITSLLLISIIKWIKVDHEIGHWYPLPEKFFYKPLVIDDPIAVFIRHDDFYGSIFLRIFLHSHQDRNDNSVFFRFQSNTSRRPGDYTSIRTEKQIDFIQHQSSNVTTAIYRVLKFKTNKINNIHATFYAYFSIQWSSLFDNSANNYEYEKKSDTLGTKEIDSDRPYLTHR